MAIGINWAEIWKPVWKAVWTDVAPEPPAPEVRSKGAGKSRPRRRHVVEIDGADVVVESAEEAVALLDQAHEQAQQRAEIAVERAAKARTRPVRKVLADARKALVVPEISAPGLEDYAAQIIKQIEDLYESSLRTIEVAALLARRERDEQDDEDVLLLIA